MKTIKKNTIKIMLIALFVTGFATCSDEYFNVNTPSSTANIEQLRINDLLAPIIHSTLEGQRSAELVFGNYAQNFVSRGGGASGEAEIGALWNQIYLYVLPNIAVIKEKATEQNAVHFSAIADILTAINLGIATDTWDNIPYSEASLGEENFFPAFDSQKTIYDTIFNLLNSAITTLQTTDNSGVSPGKEDLIYKGDTSKWLRAAYTLKARYQLHLMNKGVTSSQEVLSTIENGFTSNDDDFQMFYDEKNINPWYSSEILARNTGNFHRDIASQLVSSMNGDYYPFQGGVVEIDPRLPRFADNDINNTGGITDWKGFVSGGDGLAPDGTKANTSFVSDGYYTSINSPLLLISYAEAQFIKSEAAFLANGGTTTSVGSNSTAYLAYIEGINASMNKYGVNGADYLSDAAIDVGESGLMLNHIMKEKYIHNFLNPETFVDYRRYDFSSDVFKGLTIRKEDSDGDYKGKWFRRANYPSSEKVRNSDNVDLNTQLPTAPVWWDK